MNPFTQLRDYLMARFPEMHDVIFVLGKTSRAMYYLLIIAIVLCAREVWVRLWRKDLAGRAFKRNQAFAFATLAYALQAPFLLAPGLSWKLVLGVVTTLLIYFAALAFIRLFAAATHTSMIRGDRDAAEELGLYYIGAGFASYAVVTSAFTG